MPTYRYKLNEVEEDVLRDFYLSNIDDEDKNVLLNYYRDRLASNPLDKTAEDKIEELTSLSW